MGQSGRALRGVQDEDSAANVKRQVDSDDNFQLPIYQLANMKNGGGKLIDIIKLSAKHSSGSFAASKSLDLSASQKHSESNVSDLEA